MPGIFEGVRIVGAGQAQYAKKSTKSVQRLFYEAGTAALEDAGLTWRSVDGLAATCFLLPPDNVATLAEHLGIEARFLFQGLYGGASGVIGMAGMRQTDSREWHSTMFGNAPHVAGTVSLLAESYTMRYSSP